MEKPDPKDKGPSIITYSGIGLQIVIMIGGAAWIGKWLDEKYHVEKNWFTLGFVLFGVALAMLYAIRALNKINK